jgi:L-asparagine transporter-like permease
MKKISLNNILKKWLPIIAIVSLIVITMGLIFHNSVPQILFSLFISILLILSAFLFRSVGKNRENRSNSHNNGPDYEIK